MCSSPWVFPLNQNLIEYTNKHCFFFFFCHIFQISKRSVNKQYFWTDMPFEMFSSSKTWTNFIIKSPEELDKQLFISQRLPIGFHHQGGGSSIMNNRYYSKVECLCYLIYILKHTKCTSCPHLPNPMAIFACISEVLHGVRIYSIGTGIPPYKGPDSSQPDRRHFNQGACTGDLVSGCSCWNRGMEGDGHCQRTRRPWSGQHHLRGSQTLC